MASSSQKSESKPRSGRRPKVPEVLRGLEYFLGEHEIVDAVQRQAQHLKASLPSNSTSASQQSYTRPGNGDNVPFDNDEGQFHPGAGADGAKQERSDDDDDDDDDDDNEDNLMSIGDNAERLEFEPGDRDREQMLNEGVDAVLKALEHPAPVPGPIATAAESVCSVFRRAWENGPANTQEVKVAIDAANRKIVELNSEEMANNSEDAQRHAYRIDGDSILKAIYLTRDAAVWWFRSDDIQSSRQLASKACALFSLSLVIKLDNCGLSWKSVVHPQIKDTLMFIIGEAQPTLEDHLRKAIEAFDRRNRLHACRFQMALVDSIENSIVGFFDAIGSGDMIEARKQIALLNGRNQELKRTNQSVGFREEDRLMPLGNVKKILSDRTIATKAVNDQSRIQRLDQYRYTFGKTLEASGYQEIGRRLVSQCGPQNAEFEAKVEATVVNIIAKNVDSIGAQNREGHTVEPPQFPSTDSQAAHPLSSSQNASDRRSAVPTGHGDSVLSAEWNNDGIEILPVRRDGWTEYGKLINIQHTGRDGFRTTVNMGTEKCRILVSIPGADYGRGIIKGLYESEDSLRSRLLPLNARSRQHISRVIDIVTVPIKKPNSKRPGIVKFCLQYKEDSQENPNAHNAPLYEERSKSDCIILFGGRNVQHLEETLLMWREIKVKYLSECVRRGLDPDTKVQLTAQTIKDMLWIFRLCPPAQY